MGAPRSTVPADGSVRRMLRRRASPAETAEALERRRRAGRHGGSPVETLPARCRATVCGVVRSVVMRPSRASCAVEAEICDGTGRVTVVWIGRRAVPGVAPGRLLRASGRIGLCDGRRVLFNPDYDLLPADA